jgi:hypothetical protein
MSCSRTDAVALSCQLLFVWCCRAPPIRHGRVRAVSTAGALGTVAIAVQFDAKTMLTCTARMEVVIVTGRLARTVPADLSYVLRVGPVMRRVLLAVSLLPACFLLLIVVVLVAQGLAVPDPAGMVGLFVVAVLAGLACWRYVCRPRLAADERGIWLYARHLPPKAIWLPWDAVDRMERSTAFRGTRVIVVVPHERTAGSALGPAAAVEQAWDTFTHGGRLVVRLPAGKTTSSVLAALARLADRHAVTSSPNARPERPYRQAPRPPAGLPLELPAALSARRRVQNAARAAAVLIVVPGIVALRMIGKPVVPQLVAVGVAALVALLVVGLTMRGAFYRGPVFAADSAGAWVCYRSVAAGRHNAAWLRWDAIELFEVVAGTALVLRVKPRYAWEPMQPHVSTTNDRILGRVFQARLVVAVDPGHWSAADLVSILNRLAGGRCPVSLAAEPAAQLPLPRSRPGSMD